MFGESITLAYQMSEGESLRYKTEVISEQTISEAGQPTQTGHSLLEMTMLQSVKRIEPNGNITVDVTIESGTVKREGQEPMPLPSVGQTIQITMKKNGEIVRTSVDFPFSQPAFPDKPVKLNETWTGESKMEIPLYDNQGNPTGTKSVTLTYNYTLAGFEPKLNYETAIIQVSCPLTKVTLQEGVEQEITASGKTYFAHKKGRLIQSKVKTETKITAPGTSVGTKIKVNVELIDSGPAQDDYWGGQPDEQFIIR